MSDLPILVSSHARDQALARHRDFYVRRGVAGIVAEVAAAVRDGRRAKTKPRWASSPENRQKRRKTGTCRFVWDESETRCYAIVRGATKRGPGWVVTTVLHRIEAA